MADKLSPKIAKKLQDAANQSSKTTPSNPTKSWAPLKKRLQVISMVRLFKKDAPFVPPSPSEEQKAARPNDDGGIYCGEESSPSKQCSTSSSTATNNNVEKTKARPPAHCHSASHIEEEDCIDLNTVDKEERGASSKPNFVFSGEYDDEDRSSNSEDGEFDDEDDEDSSAESCEKEKRKSGKRFGNFLPASLQRSHSTGDQDTPAHAMFLQEKAQKAQARKTSSATAPPTEPYLGVYEGEVKDDRKKKKSIGEKLNFLTRKQQSDLPAAKNLPLKEPDKALRARPSLEQVERWGSSFDSLLNDKYGLALFRAFLKTEYSDENIEFWIACEEYRLISGARKQQSKAQKIYNEFVAFQAPREVNLDSTTRLATINSMGSPDKHLFEQAQKRIQALMDKDSYQRFLRSEVYNSLLKECRAACKSGSKSSDKGSSSNLTKVESACSSASS